MKGIRFLVNAVLTGLLAGSVGWGQDCIGLRGLGQASVPTQVQLHPEDAWGGTVYVTLDGKEVLMGVFSGQDGVGAWHSPQNAMGLGKGGSYTFAFNRQSNGTYLDTFTTFVTNATFPCPPGQIGFGSYQGSHKIIAGTGRFRNATGTLLISGTYVWLPQAGGTVEVGYWNPDITGTICNVLPAE